VKFVLWAVVIYLAWRWYSSKKSATVRAKAPAAAADPDAVEKMVVCTQCGIHLPQSEAVSDAEARNYCSEAHRASHSTS
jgi:uncharacterized protein